jgi:high-affinity iron transporter
VPQLPLKKRSKTMIQAFIIVLREGFEAFLIVAIISAYLKKTAQFALLPAVYWGILASVLASAGMGFLIYDGVNGPLWEGILGLVSAVLVAGLVWHMWKTAPHLVSDMQAGLRKATIEKAGAGAWLGVFVFTVLMITREGMETALLMIQIQDPQIWTGIGLGIAAAAAMAFLWARYGHRINLKLFFQVTAVFLFLFVIQILIYSFHEFTEAGILPNSEALHIATEPYGPDGLYGKWFSLGMVAFCAVWLLAASLAGSSKSKLPGAA